MRIVAVIEVEDGADMIGVREALAYAVEPMGMRPVMASRAPEGRLTEREGEAVRYVGGAEYIPCDMRGKCLDGLACEGCAHRDVLLRLCEVEEKIWRNT